MPRFRISDAVLCEKLSVLNENKTGFIPNKTKYKDIKSVIDNFRTIIWNNPNVENSSKTIQKGRFGIILGCGSVLA